jgi:hypothetical protein
MDAGRGSHEPVSTEKAFEMVRNAGYTGMAINLAAADRETAYKTLPLFSQYELGCVINAFPHSMEDMLPVLEMAREFNARVVNIIAQVIPSSVDEASIMVQDWMEEAEKEGIDIEFETHRNSVTNDLSYTTQLLETVPDMKLSVDLSHYVVDREFSLPLRSEEQELVDKVLRRANAFQGRVASAQQIQLQLEFPQHQKWVVQFLDWWEAGFRYWRKRAGDDDCLIFQTELAPPDYAMTGPDGMEMSDRWQESLTMKGWIEDIWARLENEIVEQAVSEPSRQPSEPVS